MRIREKSYEPTRPRPLKQAPPWTTRGIPRIAVSTDDTEFGICVTEATDSRTRRIAWKDGKGMWYEVKVDWARVKEVA